MEKKPQTSLAYARYVLVILLGVYVSNQWARYLLNYLYAVSDDDYDDDDGIWSRETGSAVLSRVSLLISILGLNLKNFVSIEDATGITTSEYGLLVGYGFSFFYVIFGLFMGRAADLYNRKLIIFYGLVIWNLATVFLGLSNNFIELLLSRILLGIGESFSMPASYSLIADYFPPESLAQANGIFAFGVYVGGGLSSLSIAMAKSVGWRVSAYTVALYGFVLALLVRFTVKEPHRARATLPSRDTRGGERNGGEDEDFTFSQSTKLIFGEPLILLLMLGGMLRFMAGYAIGSYLPDFYSQIYPSDNTIYSYLNASVVSVGGALSSFAGGYVADRWEKSGESRARLYIPAIGAMLGAPAFFLVIAVPNFYASMFFLFLEYLVAECWFGPAISVLQKALPPRVRGVGIGYWSFFTTIAGSFMTYAVGLILDAYTSDAAIKITLLASVCGMYIASGLIFLVASRFLPTAEALAMVANERQPLLDRTENGEDHPFKATQRPDHGVARRNEARETF